MKELHSIGILGGGTAGYFTAIAVKKWKPDFQVTLIESSSIPIIGVGEATTPPMLPFLHTVLGIDLIDFYERVMPTWKLGIKFYWGPPGESSFYYPFGFGEAGLAESHLYDSDLSRSSLTSMLMAADLAPVIQEADGSCLSLLTHLKFAYHLDNKRLVRFLAEQARSAGVQNRDEIIDEVRVTADGERIDALITRDGRELRYDLYIDCSGFRSLLIEGALSSEFLSYQASLYCDNAVIANVPHAGVLKPYTLAESMNHGWCWCIPQVEEDHRGYVYSSGFCTPEEAVSEMRNKNPGMGDSRIVKFRSGRHAHFWKGNAIAIGNSYGFVEPLESTALHMVILEILELFRILRLPGGSDVERARSNRKIGEHWDYLRWFLALHYKFNRKLDTPFWRECREAVDISGFESILERYRTRGLLSRQRGLRRIVEDPLFGYRGMDLILLGQTVEPGPTKPVLSRQEWEATMGRRSRFVERALPQKQALKVVCADPQMLFESSRAAYGWQQKMAVAWARSLRSG